MSELRKDRGLTQQQLADALNVSKNSISAYERNAACPSDATRVAIATYFNVSLDYLYGLIDNPLEIERSSSSNVILFEHLPEKAMEEIKKAISDVVTKYHTANLSDRQT